MKEMIRSLTEAFGPPGHEAGVRALVEDALRNRVDRLSTTSMGSLLAVRNPGAPLRVMLAAHLDEVGVIVSHVDARGFARLQPLGALEAEACLGRRVRFAGGLSAVVGVEDRMDRKRALTLEQLFLDFGPTHAGRGKARVGAIGAFQAQFAERAGRVVAGNLSGRMGAAALIEVLLRLKQTPHEVQCAFTSQQEVGNRGALTAAYALDPHLALTIAVSRAGDTPGGPRSPVNLGGGPALVVGEERTVSDPRLVDLLARRAKAARVPLQYAVTGAAAGEAAAIQPVRAGVPAASLSIPCRYVHSASEMADLGDVEHCVRLLLEVLRRPIRLTADAAG